MVRSGARQLLLPTPRVKTSPRRFRGADPSCQSAGYARGELLERHRSTWRVLRPRFEFVKLTPEFRTYYCVFRFPQVAKDHSDAHHRTWLELKWGPRPISRLERLIAPNSCAGSRRHATGRPVIRNTPGCAFGHRYRGLLPLEIIGGWACGAEESTQPMAFWNSEGGGGVLAL